jgi:DNA gyrase subunit B
VVNDEELAKELAARGWSKSDAKLNIQRFKGLGEMNPEELGKTTMDPKTRTILQVTLKDAAEANEIFSDLMGEKVEPRKDFIYENAKFVVNLDI